MEQAEWRENDDSQEAETVQARSLVPGRLQASDYLSIRDAAARMGISPRSIYGYIKSGKLLGMRIGVSIAVHKEDVEKYSRTVVGRPRTRIPKWRVPVEQNPQYLTRLTGYIREGQEECLKQKLTAIRKENAHQLPGTVARYIVCNAGGEIQIILVWRKVNMPPEEERQTALVAFCDDLAETIDWQTELGSEGLVVMNT